MNFNQHNRQKEREDLTHCPMGLQHMMINIMINWVIRVIVIMIMIKVTSLKLMFVRRASSWSAAPKCPTYKLFLSLYQL